MRENVVSLKPEIVLPGEPCGTLVEMIEGLLARAKAGNLRGLAYACANQDESVGTGWDGAQGTKYPLCTAVSILAVRYPLAIVDASEN